MTKKKIFFIHTIASAGGDFAYYLQYLYKPNSFICVPDIKKGCSLNTPRLRAEYREELLKKQFDNRIKKGDEINLIYGHIPYLKNYKKLFHNEFSCMTLLRDPVKRFVSNYRKDINQNNTLREFKEFIKTYKSVPGDLPSEANFINFNWQTAFISGFYEYGTCYKKMTNEILTIAKKNLEEFFFIGISDYFDDSVKLFSKITSNKYIYHKPLKKYKANNVIPINQDILKYIKEKSYYDNCLYEYAKDIFFQRKKKYENRELIFPSKTEKYLINPIKRLNITKHKAIAKLKNNFFDENIHI